MANPMAWRFLPYQVADAATNMAIDEAILEAHMQGLVPPTLRLYGFNPPAVTIGHNQKTPAGLVIRAHARGFEVVRRPTGGRAVLHLNDVTYSFVGRSIAAGGSSGQPVHNSSKSMAQDADAGFLSSSVSGAYKQICNGLQSAFQLLGLDLELGAAEAAYRRLHDCFLATTASDLHFRGKKMIGSAQLRRRNGVLQHGSILLDQDQEIMSELLADKPANAKQIRHANLYESAGRSISIEVLQEAIRKGFEMAFQVALNIGSLSDPEEKMVREFRNNYV